MPVDGCNVTEQVVDHSDPDLQCVHARCEEWTSERTKWGLQTPSTQHPSPTGPSYMAPSAHGSRHPLPWVSPQRPSSMLAAEAAHHIANVGIHGGAGVGPVHQDGGLCMHPLGHRTPSLRCVAGPPEVHHRL